MRLEELWKAGVIGLRIYDALTTRGNHLNGGNVLTLEEAAKLTERQALSRKGIGRKSFRQWVAVLEAHGYTLPS